MATSELTPRQREVAEHLLSGEPNKQIAAALGVSERAIKAHISEMLRRFGVSNRSALIGQLIAARTDPHVALGAAEFAAYERAPFMVAVTHGPRHRFVFVNDMSARVAGRSASSLLGREMLDAYPDLDPRYLAALDAVYATGTPWSAPRSPARFTHEDGSHKDTFLNLLFAPLRDARGEIIGLLHFGAEADSDDELKEDGHRRTPA